MRMRILTELNVEIARILYFCHHHVTPVVLWQSLRNDVDWRGPVGCPQLHCHHIHDLPLT